jgi:uncharacterized protein (DUF2252 family)
MKRISREEGQAMRDPIQEFMDYNRTFAARNPELLGYKVARMAASPFGFFRGSFHLFARDVLERVGGALPLLTGTGVEMDIVGDIHSENYGTFKAESAGVHYDINDFDETTTGRFDFDVCRLAVSHFLAAREREDALGEAVAVALAGTTTYAETVRRLLKKGKDPQLDVSEASPCNCPAIDDLVKASAAAKRPAFIDRLTELKGTTRRLIRSTNYFNLKDAEREQALRLLADYRQRMPGGPGKDDYYAVEDVCGRVSGIGSMGRLRYVVLVTGKGCVEGRNVLLEFKEARPSAYDLYRHRETEPSALAGRAERVVSVQRHSQAASNQHLGFAVDGGQSFQVRQLGPQDARVNTKALPPGGLECVVRVQASILARVHARSAMRAVGPANPLAELADADAFCQRVLAFALVYADVVQRDWTCFVGARAEVENVEAWAAGAKAER